MTITLYSAYQPECLVCPWTKHSNLAITCSQQYVIWWEDSYCWYALRLWTWRVIEQDIQPYVCSYLTEFSLQWAKVLKEFCVYVHKENISSSCSTVHMIPIIAHLMHIHTNTYTHIHTCLQHTLLTYCLLTQVIANCHSMIYQCVQHQTIFQMFRCKCCGPRNSLSCLCIYKKNTWKIKNNSAKVSWNRYLGWIRKAPQWHYKKVLRGYTRRTFLLPGHSFLHVFLIIENPNEILNCYPIQIFTTLILLPTIFRQFLLLTVSQTPIP